MLNSLSPLVMFAIDDIDAYSSLDKCINATKKPDMFPIASLIRGHPQYKAKRQKSVHLKPVAFVRFNTKRGKGKTVTIKALLDSGGAESLVTETYAKKLKIR